MTKMKFVLAAALVAVAGITTPTSKADDYRAGTAKFTQSVKVLSPREIRRMKLKGLPSSRPSPLVILHGLKCFNDDDTGREVCTATLVACTNNNKDCVEVPVS